MRKRQLREEIGALTEEYLSRGGVIKQLPRTEPCWPQTDAEFGFGYKLNSEYEPWNHGRAEDED